jgi:protein-disulfide isomerase
LEIHPLAVPAARAAEAAGRQGKFWEMVDTLFAAQNDWTKSADVRETFALYADGLGLDKDRFLADYEDSDEADEKIRQGISTGNSVGVRGTPTFFVNNVKIENPSSYDDFRAIVEQARDQ